MPTRFRFRLGLMLSLLMMTALPAFASDSADECDTVEAMPNKTPRADGLMKEIFHVKGDATDPTHETQNRGLQPGYELNKSALGHPMCLYVIGGQEMIVELDVYKVGLEPMTVHLLCPHCTARDHDTRNALRLTAGHKKMSYDPAGVVPTFPGWSDHQMVTAFPMGAGGLFSVDRFRCAWEVDGKHRHAIGNICDFEVTIDKNVVRPVSRGQVGAVLGRLRGT